MHGGIGFGRSSTPLTGVDAGQFVEALLANACDAIAVSDRASGRFLEVSDSYCRLTGYSRAELIGRTSVELGLVADAETRAERLDRALRATAAMHEIRLHRKDGSVRVVEFSAQLLAAGPSMLTISRDVTEHRASEARMRAIEQNSRAAIESMPDSFAIASPVRGVDGEIVDFRWEFVNDAYCALIGFDREHLLGRRGSELFPGFRDTERFLTYRQVAITREPSRIQTLTPGRSGATARVIENTVIAVGDRVAVSGRDITERHEAEAKLAAAEVRFRAAVESMLDSFTIVSPVRDDDGEIVDFRYEHVNDAHCALTGFNREQLLGHRLGELFAGFPGSTRFALYRQVALTGAPARTEDVTGEQAWVGTGLAGRVMDTMIVATGENLVISGRDVTERHVIEAQLRASEQRFRTSVESMLDAFTIISPVHDADGEIVDFRYEYINDAYCTMIGFDREQILGHRGSDLVPGFPGSERFAIYRQVAATGEACRIEDVIPSAGAGTAAPAGRLIALNIVAMGGDLVVSGRDVTERRDAERRIRELNRDLDRRAAQLEAANGELEAFAYSVAHDLRTPLRAIAGFSDLLGRGGHIAEDDEAGQSLLERVTAAARRMGELIDALLELAQLSRCELEITPVPLGAVADEIAEELRCSGEPREVRFAIEDGLEAGGDLRLVRILLRSLLENAWKYTGGREHALIEVARAGPGLFVVRDNGAGFDMEFAAQLFKPFGRLHRQDEFPGTGVGLATAERIVRRHGGTLRGEGEVGRGAAFYFSLEPDAREGR